MKLSISKSLFCHLFLIFKKMFPLHPSLGTTEEVCNGVSLASAQAVLPHHSPHFPCPFKAPFYLWFLLTIRQKWQAKLPHSETAWCLGEPGLGIQRPRLQLARACKGWQPPCHQLPVRVGGAEDSASNFLVFRTFGSLKIIKDSQLLLLVWFVSAVIVLEIKTEI